MADPELTAALAELMASPLVKDVKPLAGGGYYATLWCSSELHSSRKSEQVQMSLLFALCGECYEQGCVRALPQRCSMWAPPTGPPPHARTSGPSDTEPRNGTEPF